MRWRRGSFVVKVFQAKVSMSIYGNSPLFTAVVLVSRTFRARSREVYIVKRPGESDNRQISDGV